MIKLICGYVVTLVLQHYDRTRFCVTEKLIRNFGKS